MNMAAENRSASLVAKFSIPNNQLVPDGYYTSKLITVPDSANPLVDSATPILTLLERLSISPTLPVIDDLRDNIAHELKAFHSRLFEQKYPEEQIIIASYMLTATIDELVGKNYLRVEKEPAEFKSFTPSSFDDIGPEERFFEIITHLKERSNQYLDLIELGYYCVATGFEGKHHLLADGRQALDNLLEDLFQLIKTHRVNKPIRLFKQVAAPQSSPQKSNMHLYALGAAGIIIISAIYYLSNNSLDNKAHHLLTDSHLAIQTE